MTPSAILILIIIYSGVLFFISQVVSKKDIRNEAFFEPIKIQNGFTILWHNKNWPLKDSFYFCSERNKVTQGNSTLKKL